jgi:hypothetical protein
MFRAQLLIEETVMTYDSRIIPTRILEQNLLIPKPKIILHLQAPTYTTLLNSQFLLRLSNYERLV